MAIQKVLAVFILTAVIVIAGCTSAANTSPYSPKSPESPGQAPAQQNPAAQVQNPSVSQCTANAGCTDNDPCTTDTCEAGICKHTAEVDCQTKLESKPKISSADFGTIDKEFVQIDGKNYNLAGWKITNAKGNTFIQFDKNTYRIINGKITIYSGCGTTGSLSSDSTIYQCLDNDFFSNTGGKAILYDENSTIVDQLAK